jgi:hypothetical protein
MWSKLDALDDGAAAPAPTPKPDDKSKPAEGTAPPAQPAPDDDKPPQFRTSKEMRAWGDRQFAEAKKAKQEKQALEAKLATLEGKSPQTAEGEAILATKIADLQKQIQSYESVIEHHAFENSAKYKTEFQQPYVAARDKAVKLVKDLRVKVKTGKQDDDGNPVLEQRQATEADWQRIYDLPTADAWDLAEELFGNRASLVMQHRENVSEKAESAISALNNHRQNLDKQRTEAQQRERFQQVQNQNLWKTSNDKIGQDPKRQEYWGEDKDDPESNTALARGFQIADLFFSEARDKMQPQERIMFDALVRHRIAGFSKLAHKNRKLAESGKEKDAEIAKLRGSAPGAAGGGTPDAKPPRKGPMEALDGLPD